MGLWDLFTTVRAWQPGSDAAPPKSPKAPDGLDGRMHDYLADLEQRNGTACLKLMAIALTGVHFKALDDLAHGSTYQDANAALERTISEGCRLIIALK